MLPSDHDDALWELIDRITLQDGLDRLVDALLRYGPVLQQWLMEDIIETLFMPRAIYRQMLLALVLQTTRILASQTNKHVIQGMLVPLWSTRARLAQQLQHQQSTCTTQDEWMELAERMDQLLGHDVWRQDPNCLLYELQRIQTTMDQYVHLMRRGHIFELLYLLRGANLSRNKFGLLHKGLFTRAMAGTKVLIETYHQVVCAALEFVCDAQPQPKPNHHLLEQDDDAIPTDVRLAFFNETRHAYGRTAILLSGGAALGFYHVGVVKALLENNVMPRVIGGSSAGSLVCAMIGTRTEEECLHDLFHQKPTHAPGHSGMLQTNFFRPLLELPSRRTGWFRQLARLVYDLMTGKSRLHQLIMSDTEHFRSVVKANCGNFTFQEAFDRTGCICNIIVSPKNQSDPPRLLNYLTAPHVLVWSAAVASAAVPGIFEPCSLMVRDADGTVRFESSASHGERGTYQDGSFEQDLPMQQLSEMFNINHFIISQVNPQAVMFGNYMTRSGIWSNPLKAAVDAILKFLKEHCRSWVVNVSEFFAAVGSSRFRPYYSGQRTQLLTQEYEGRDCDISLVPWLHHRGLVSAFLHMLYNPTTEDFYEWVLAAERETWKFIPTIKSHIAEEITLDQCVQRLRNRLMLESWQKRRGASSTQVMIGNGLPSFFVSPSLNNLDAVESASDLETQNAGAVPPNNSLLSASASHYEVPLNDAIAAAATPASPRSNVRMVVPNHVDLSSGWGGLGLRGNRSSFSAGLDSQMSHGSGFFIDDFDDTENNTTNNFMPRPHSPTHLVRNEELCMDNPQEAGPPNLHPFATALSNNPNLVPANLQSRSNPSLTNTMARFYYQKDGSYDTLPPPG